MASALTRSEALRLVPSHNRTLCSDVNIINAHDGDWSRPRCTRCAILEAIRDDIWDELSLEVEVTGRWIGDREWKLERW